MQGKVEICGINTAKLEVLKNDEMTELLRRTKEGDMAAREKLIRHICDIASGRMTKVETLNVREPVELYLQGPCL